MAQNTTTAVKMVESGHVRVGPEMVLDPAFLVPRSVCFNYSLFIFVAKRFFLSLGTSVFVVVTSRYEDPKFFSTDPDQAQLEKYFGYGSDSVSMITIFFSSILLVLGDIFSLLFLLQCNPDFLHHYSEFSSVIGSLIATFLHILLTRTINILLLFMIFFLAQEHGRLCDVGGHQQDPAARPGVPRSQRRLRCLQLEN